MPGDQCLQSRDVALLAQEHLEDGGARRVEELHAVTGPACGLFHQREADVPRGEEDAQVQSLIKHHAHHLADVDVADGAGGFDDHVRVAREAGDRSHGLHPLEELDPAGVQTGGGGAHVGGDELGFGHATLVRCIALAQTGRLLAQLLPAQGKRMDGGLSSLDLGCGHGDVLRVAAGKAGWVPAITTGTGRVGCGVTSASNPKASRMREGWRTSPGVPLASIRPARMTTIRSAYWAARLRSWRITSTAAPSRANATARCSVRCSWAGSRLEVGSSSSSARPPPDGASQICASTRARWTRWRSPPESRV